RTRGAGASGPRAKGRYAAGADVARRRMTRGRAPRRDRAGALRSLTWWCWTSSTSSSPDRGSGPTWAPARRRSRTPAAERGAVVVVVDSLRVVVSGDAEGAGVTLSRSVTRSVLSVQPAIMPTPSATTQNPVSSFFIVLPPRGFETRPGGCNGGAADASIGVR